MGGGGSIFFSNKTYKSRTVLVEYPRMLLRLILSRFYTIYDKDKTTSPSVKCSLKKNNIVFKAQALGISLCGARLGGVLE